MGGLSVKMNQYQHYRQLLRSLGWIALVLGALEFLQGPTVSLAAGAPKVSVSETSHDFGKVVEDQALTYTFEIKNSGGQPLQIEDVDPDCACTVPDYDETIPPGGQGKVTLTIKPFTVLNKFRKKAVVTTNDPSHGEATLVLTGVVTPLIEVQPGNIIRFLGDPREPKESQVRFISHLSGPWEIKDFRTNIPDKIEVKVKAEEPGRVYVLEVKNRVQEGGRYTGLIEVFTTSKERPRMIVRVFASLYPPSAANP